MYNASKYVAHSINSVISQTFHNWELLIVDDKSTDNSRDIVKKFTRKDNRIHLLCLEENSGGPAKPRNTALMKSEGDYIAFIDSDDIWLPDKLEKQLFVIKRDRVDLVAGEAEIISNANLTSRKLRSWKTYNILKKIGLQDSVIILYTNYLPMSSTIVRKDIINGIIFNEDKSLVALEDWLFWIEVFINNNDLQFSIIQHPVIQYRELSDSISQRNRDTGYRKALYMMSYLLHSNKISFFKYITGKFVVACKIARFHLLRINQNNSEL